MQAQSPVQMRHLCTYGSKLGIHPPKLLNRRAVTTVLGQGDHPWGIASPSAVAADLRGRVWIADSATSSVHVFDPATGAYREIRSCGEDILQVPMGIVADSLGRIFLADSASGAVYAFNEEGEFDHRLFPRKEHPLEHPSALALSADSKTLYVLDPPRNAVVEFNREGDVDATIQLPGELRAPSAMTVVGNRICVLGSQTHRVEAFAPDGRLLEELRWDEVRVPVAIAYDALRARFLVANPQWMVVQVFDDRGRGLGAFGQLGAGVDQVAHIDGVVVDGKGRAYLIDGREGKVVVFAE